MHINLQVTDPNHPGLPLMQALMASINEAEVSHDTVLDALLSLYGAVLLHHPCCYISGAGALLLQLDKLKSAIAEQVENADQLTAGAIAHAARKTH